MTRLRFPWLLLALGLAACGAPKQRPVEIRFEARIGDLEARCGTEYNGLGTAGAPAELGDARLYVSNFALLSNEGGRVPITLEQESPWQHESVALLDFEDQTGRCSEVGTAQMNHVVTGSVPTGDYVGLSFELGVPHELNHLDATTAPSPLNLNALYWNWQLGYIFTKVEFWNSETLGTFEDKAVDVANDEAKTVAKNAATNSAPEPTAAAELEPTVAFLTHFGSTGCESPARTMAPKAPCSRPNRVAIVLDGFDPDVDIVNLDLAGLVDGIDITQSVLRPPGCMSSPSDPDCTAPYANLGLDLATGRCFTDCTDQKLVSRRAGHSAD